MMPLSVNCNDNNDTEHQRESLRIDIQIFDIIIIAKKEEDSYNNNRGT